MGTKYFAPYNRLLVTRVSMSHQSNQGVLVRRNRLESVLHIAVSSADSTIGDLQQTSRGCIPGSSADEPGEGHRDASVTAGTAAHREHTKSPDEDSFDDKEDGTLQSEGYRKAPG